MAHHYLKATAAAVCLALALTAQAESDSLTYVPHLHGTLRPRMEMTTEGDPHYRFQLRNARVCLDGMIAKSVDYFLQADLCDRGTMKFLDGWIRLAVSQGLKFQAGQFRMPFAVDPFRGPHTYLFANRSFIGKQIFNNRAVGAKVCYSMPSRPLILEAGVFNPSKIGDHTPWNHSVAFASKAVYTVGDVTFTAGFASISPDSSRLNVTDCCVTWKSGRWLAEAEYMDVHYANRNFKDCHAYNAYIDYRMPIKAGLFNRLSFQGRFDGITAHSTGVDNEEGLLEVNNRPRNRITVGTTISYIKSKSMFLDLRADYEKYFYHSGVKVSPEMGDKIVMEMVLRF